MHPTQPRREPNDWSGDDSTPRFVEWMVKPSAAEKLTAGFENPRYPWPRGDVFRYNSTHTFVLAAAMDAFLKRREGPPYRTSAGCFVQVPFMWGHGGNFVIPLPNGVTVFRFTDVDPATADVEGLILAGDPLCTRRRWPRSLPRRACRWTRVSYGQR